MDEALCLYVNYCSRLLVAKHLFCHFIRFMSFEQIFNISFLNSFFKKKFSVRIYTNIFLSACTHLRHFASRLNSQFLLSLFPKEQVLGKVCQHSQTICKVLHILDLLQASLLFLEAMTLVICRSQHLCNKCCHNST